MFKESFDVTVTAKNAQEAYYSYDGAEWVAFDETAKVTIGKEELKNGDEVGLYLYAFDKDGKAVEKSYTYTKEVEGTVGSGFLVRVKKSDFAYNAYSPALKKCGHIRNKRKEMIPM